MNGPTELEIMGICIALIAVIGGISISESDRITGERLDKFSHLKRLKNSYRLSPESHPEPDSANLPPEVTT